MDPERWRQVDALLQSALQLSMDARDAFLRHACGEDHALERDVRSLLDAQAHAGDFLDRPAIDIAARSIAEDVQLTLSADGDLIGSAVSHYQVVERLGAGGMGVVYKAQDTRLHRPVALKFLSQELAADTEALTRFRREARAASSLNHPNICTVYDIGEHEGHAFIAMEYLDGTTLSQRIDSGPLDSQTLLTVSRDVLDALETAHAAGIIHRDIKPANLFLTARGSTKVMDFGVAKVRASDPATGVLTATATALHAVTAFGSAIGTLAYMSPEQVRGEEVDSRSDLFSFGVALYEMATGARPFQGATTSLLLDSILNRDPVAPSQINASLPADLDLIILKCLAKRRELRYQRASEVRNDLLRLLEGKEPSTRKAARRAPLAWVVAGVVVTVLAIAASGYFRPAPALTDRDTIVLADFDNTTGDAVFDAVLRQGVSVQLGQSPFLSLVSDARIRQQLQLMGQPADAPLTPQLAKELCVRNGSSAIVHGSIASLGRQYVLGMRAENCSSGDVIYDEQAQAGTKEDVLDVLGRMASDFRTDVGESLASVQQHSTPLEEATTPSLEALKAYSTGLKVGFSSGPAAAVPLYTRAIEIDPGFARAHAVLGITYSNLGESVLSGESTIKAYQLRARASDQERFFIEAMYDRQVTGNLERLQQTYESWARSYPRDASPHGLSAGFALTGTGQYQASIEAAKRAIVLDPDVTPAYASLAFSSLHLDRLRDAEAAIQQATARQLDHPDFLLIRHFIAFLNADEAAMRQEVARAKDRQGAEDGLTHVQSLMLARAGRLREATRLSRLACDLAQRAGRTERAAMFAAGAAVTEAFFGHTVAARQRAADALAISTGRDVQYAAAFAFALTGESSRSRSLVDDLEKRFPEDTSVRYSYLPTLRAILALNAGEPATAIQEMQTSARFDLAMHGLAFNGFFGALHAVYVRGLAYLAAQQPVEAAAEFRKILDHRGIVLGDPMGAMARLQLARALALSGDSVKAKAAYQDLLNLWSAADPDVALLKQARAEHAKLP